MPRHVLPPSIRIAIVLENDMECELDRVNIAVRESDEIAARVIDTIRNQSWTLAAGDVIRIQERT